MALNDRSISRFLTSIQGVPRSLGQILRGGRGHHKDLDLNSNPWSRKRLRSALSDVVHKSIGGNRPPFQLPLLAEEYGTVLRTPSRQECI
ncbi:hypothetical protein TNCV_4542671 [Trichonephila clavipes]|nr:hypothetical protein TNCV_4542671 [Trichonephila clavipes]